MANFHLSQTKLDDQVDGLVGRDHSNWWWKPALGVGNMIMVSMTGVRDAEL